MRTTIECRSFRASPLPSGGIMLEIEDETPDVSEDRLHLDEIATLLRKSVRQVDKLSRRQSNPLPLIRGQGRPYAFRSRINHWIAGVPASSGAASVREVFGC